MPILDEHTLDFISHSSAQTYRFGVRLGLLLRAGDLFCLQGDLRTGKTCLVQGIGEGMGVVEPITSPSFTVIAEHRPPAPAPVLYHIDLYRLDQAEAEARAMGLDEYLWHDGVCVIEWAERLQPGLPAERLWITLRHLDMTKRGVVMKAEGPRYDKLLREFRKAAFGV
jgi:tRNA threonylcarbamoyladenosine biosynthesis protein TsaE